MLKSGELNIRSHPEDSNNASLIQSLEIGNSVEVYGPLGHCTYKNWQDKPMFLVAGGTGFSQMKSLLEEVVKAHDQRKIHLFWGLRNPEDLYYFELMEKWKIQLENFKFDLVYEGEWVQERVVTTYPNLVEFQAVIAGPFNMVKSVWACFKEHHMDANDIISDVL